MKWLKYYHKWASGIEKECNYVMFDEKNFDINNKESIRSFITEMGLTKEGEWSEMYRGVDYEIVDHPDAAWLMNEVKNTEERIQHLEKYLKTLRDILLGKW